MYLTSIIYNIYDLKFGMRLARDTTSPAIISIRILQSFNVIHSQHLKQDYNSSNWKINSNLLLAKNTKTKLAQHEIKVN